MSTLDKDEYERRFLAAVAETKTAGIWFSNAVPPIIRLLRRIGFRPLPPHYIPFKTMLLRLCIYFAVAWGLLMGLFIWDAEKMPLSVLIGLSLGAGLLFGLCMALYYAYGRKAHKLTPWDDL